MKRIAALGVVAGLMLAGCGAAPDQAASPTTPAATETPANGGGGGGTAAAPSGFLPCIVSDQGGFTDRSFNQLSYEGVVAAAGALGTDYLSVQSADPSAFLPNLNAMIAQNCTLVTSVGFQLSSATVEVANANPDVHFLIVDDEGLDADGNRPANLKPLLYDTAQAAFLAGYLAAGFSQTGKVGTFGGMNFPTVTIFMAGFQQGVHWYNQEHGTNVEVVGCGTAEDCSDGSFTGGFEANQTAVTTAQNIIDQGVDVILPVGGPIYQSAVAAIKDSGRDIALIGVDADLFETDESTQDYVLTSIRKKMDVSVKDAIVAAAGGDFTNDPYIGTLANQGVDIAPFHNFEAKIDPALKTSVDTLRQKIIDGEIPVHSYLAGQ